MVFGGGSVRDFRLTSWQRRRLRAARKSVRDAGVAMRILALLKLDQGTSPTEVAADLGVTRQTVYNWVRRFGAGGGLHTLYDRERCGRPSKLSEALRGVLEWLLKQPPDAFGYAAVGWTTSLLRELLATRMDVHVSDDTIRRALHRMDHAWKRPRYLLRPDPDREEKKLDSSTNRAAT